MPQAELYAPTPEERSSAMLPHILQVFGGFVPPLVILIVKRNSLYVRFHSLQTLIFQLIATALVIVGFISFFIGMFASIASIPPNSKQMPKAFFFLPLIWLLFLFQYGLSILLAVVFGWQCSEGKWSRYPLIGRLAARWTYKRSDQSEAAVPSAS